MIIIALFVGLIFLYSLISARLKQTVMVTVMLSIFAHGFSALPGIDRYARKVAEFDADAPEKRLG